MNKAKGNIEELNQRVREQDQRIDEVKTQRKWKE